MNLKVPASLNPEESIGWCPGCGHGIIMRMLAECVQELGLDEKMILVEDVACGSLGQFVVSWNSIGAAHGRPIIVAAGAKRVRPNDIVVAHPGDGSAYSIGMESTIHCALRNENILALVVNNCVFGMTGGQMSPESLPGQTTTSSPFGRDININGHPFDVVKTLREYDIAYLARGSVSTPAHVLSAQKMIKKALQKQLNGEGFCLVEILSPCPTNWGFPDDRAYQALSYMREHQEKFYELGEFIDKGE